MQRRWASGLPANSGLKCGQFKAGCTFWELLVVAVVPEGLSVVVVVAVVVVVWEHPLLYLAVSQLK